jgi:hypothetical protein
VVETSCKELLGAQCSDTNEVYEELSYVCTCLAMGAVTEPSLLHLS